MECNEHCDTCKNKDICKTRSLTNYIVEEINKMIDKVIADVTKN